MMGGLRGNCGVKKYRTGVQRRGASILDIPGEMLTKDHDRHIALKPMHPKTCS